MVTSSIRSYDPSSYTPSDALIAAIIELSGSLELHPILTRFVETACTLTGAQYGALGILNGDGQFDDMIVHGMDPETIQRLGAPPQGHGVLGEITYRPKTLRLADLSSHPSSIGFPPGHPPMTTFLGCPVLIGGEIFGNIYLTEKADGAEFTDRDERVLEALAAAAASAIAHTRTLAQAEARERWHRGAAEAQEILTSATDRHGWVDALDRIQSVIGADHVEMIPPNQANARLGGLAEELILQPTARVVEGDGLCDLFDTDMRLCLVIPITTSDNSMGTLLLGWRRLRDPLPKNVLAALGQTLGDRLTVAALLHHRRAESERIAILEDRDRIAQDLHDRVIQRIFAAGMRVQSVMRTLDDSAALERLEDVATDLDDTVTDVRRAIFELHEGNAALGLSTTLETLGRNAREALGFEPTVVLSGEYWTLDDALVTDLMAVVREALSNIARHAHAHSARIEVHVGEEIMVKVTDDGIGIPEFLPRRSGVDHLKNRAERWGGRCVIRQRRSTHGTLVDWRVPNRRYQTPGRD